MPATRTLIAAALAGTIALGTLAGATIPAHMKSSAAPDWRETHGAAPTMDGQDYYVEPAPQDLSPPMATTSWLYSSDEGVAEEPAALIPYAYDGDELADAGSLPVTYDPAEPSASANALAEEQAAAAQEVADEVKQAEAEAPARPAAAS